MTSVRYYTSTELAWPGPAAPAGPDDDPEFLRALERRIRGEEPGGLS